MSQAAMDAPSSLHIAMYPWFAMGHLTPFLHLSNKLARRGHTISFFIPTATQSKFQHMNLFPHLITFFPITVPHVEGLPQGAETSSDVGPSLVPLLMTAMDRTQNQIRDLLLHLKPHIVLFDFAHWLPNLARALGIKSVQYWITGLVSAAYARASYIESTGNNSAPVFPDSSIKLRSHERRIWTDLSESELGDGIGFVERIASGRRFSDAIAFKSCREIEGPFADYLEKVFERPILLSGPGIPEPSSSSSNLDPKWAHWLQGFKPRSVIYCAFGSECTLQLNQFHELLLGLELTGMPFFAALKIPKGFGSIEAAMGEGFAERVKGRGIVHGGWVQQQLMLEHPSVGCFITHCGFGSVTEALVSECQIVLLPNLYDQIVNARMLSSRLRVGVEVEKQEQDGFFTKESVCKALRTVMDCENEVGREVRQNHAKLRTLLLANDLESGYVDTFSHKLQQLLK